MDGQIVFIEIMGQLLWATKIGSHTIAGNYLIHNKNPLLVGTTGADKKLFNRGALGTIIYYNSDNQKPDNFSEGEKLPQYAVF